MPKANPQTVKYPPEELLFGRLIAGPIANNGTSDVTNLIRIAPRVVCATGLSTTRTDNVQLHATADVLTDVINLNAGALQGIDRLNPLQLWSVKAYRLWVENKTGAPITNRAVRDKYLVETLNTVLKLRWGLSLDEEDQRLEAKFSLRKNLAAGRLPYRFPALSEAELIRAVWVARLMTAGAASNEGIGDTITIPKGEKVILTAISSEAPDGVTDEVYVKVDRDKDQTDYLEINIAALPNSLDWVETLWVPAVEEMAVRLVCQAAQAGGHRVRYQYVRAPLTLADKVKWGLDMTEEEKTTAQELDLYDRIAAGIYPLGV